MKKTIAILLAVFLLISLAGCHSQTLQTDPHDHSQTLQADPHDHSHTLQADPHDHSHTQPQANTTQETSLQSAPTDETSEHTDSYTQSPTYTDPQVVVLSDTLQRGVTDGNTYTSPTLGLVFEKPSDWAFMNESDLAAFSGLASDGFGDFAATASENPAVYDMYASNEYLSATATICYENLLTTIGNSLTSKEYAEIIKTASIENPDSSLISESEITLGARTYTKLVMKFAQTDGTNIKTYYLTPVGNFMATIIVTLPESSELSADDMFS